MHANAERVAAALRAAEANGAADRIQELADSARTAVEAADALGVPVGAIVKSLVFAADGQPILVLASGDHQVDTAKVATVLGVGTVKRADADLVREATGFPIGGVAPVGHPAPLATVVDEHLGDFEIVWAAAGTPHAVFPTSYDELVRVSGGTPAEVARS
ncbi:MAG TPA: YbaK/EbsC family protein [Mycobacteriales bacterium]|nr:YbaK/EbsC family protein [Mycobacteriales bacterium]